MTRDCESCQFSELAWLKVEHVLMCISPQLRSAHNRKSRCIFERDGYEGEHNRDTEATRKCGVDGSNYVARTA